MVTESVNKKLDAIENEILSLKSMIIQTIQQKPKLVLKIKGVLKGISVSKEDIEKAKKSLFKIGA